MKESSGSPNFWSDADIQNNILGTYDKEQTNFTKFHRESIMIYATPKRLLLEGEGIPANYKLSALGIKFMRETYPMQ
ncbi:uncharacterized protein SOCE26_097680 [Sorangium cellulosum]|uniref:Uncharacterized protein n=1 Tax=Sorangium cellulosum TaxID=56 RepID=A0A2L0F9P4_SORCE|nr:hypothetical protein [Sorangium cellulosum]AUX48237.1 uncharacterized protein SOCE26_097680 [Sorangium cellulosum]